MEGKDKLDQPFSCATKISVWIKFSNDNHPEPADKKGNSQFWGKIYFWSYNKEQRLVISQTTVIFIDTLHFFPTKTHL